MKMQPENCSFFPAFEQHRRHPYMYIAKTHDWWIIYISLPYACNNATKTEQWKWIGRKSIKSYGIVTSEDSTIKAVSDNNTSLQKETQILKVYTNNLYSIRGFQQLCTEKGVQTNESRRRGSLNSHKSWS